MLPDEDPAESRLRLLERFEELARRRRVVYFEYGDGSGIRYWIVAEPRPRRMHVAAWLQWRETIAAFEPVQKKTPARRKAAA